MSRLLTETLSFLLLGIVIKFHFESQLHCVTGIEIIRMAKLSAGCQHLQCLGSLGRK